MKAARKTPLLFALKVAVLAAIVAYAMGKLQLDDELVVPSAGSLAARVLQLARNERPEQPARFVLPTADGRTIEVAEGTRLRLVAAPNARRLSAATLPPEIQGTATANPAAAANSRFPAVRAPDFSGNGAGVDHGSAPDSPELIGADRTPSATYRAKTKDGTVVVLASSYLTGGTPVFERLPGIRSALAELRIGWFIASIAIFGPALFLMVPRWHMLLRAAGIRVPFWTAARLTYMSHFLNTFMPGGAGGDLVKAVYITHHSEKKAEAATMVLIDRMVGVLGLLAMSGLIVLLNYRRLHGIALPIGGLSLLVGLGAALFFSKTVRRVVRYDALLARLPRAELWVRIDRALWDLRDNRRALLAAFGLTTILQLLEVVAIGCAGRALGIHKAEMAHYLAFVPIGYLINAVPLSFGGLGLMEGAYLHLFTEAGVATASQGFMLGLLARLAAAVWGLPGGLSALFPPKRPTKLEQYDGATH